MYAELHAYLTFGSKKYEYGKHGHLQHRRQTDAEKRDDRHKGAICPHTCRKGVPFDTDRDEETERGSQNDPLPFIPFPENPIEKEKLRGEDKKRERDISESYETRKN